MSRFLRLLIGLVACALVSPARAQINSSGSGLLSSQQVATPLARPASPNAQRRKRVARPAAHAGGRTAPHASEHAP